MAAPDALRLVDTAPSDTLFACSSSSRVSPRVPERGARSANPIVPRFRSHEPPVWALHGLGDGRGIESRPSSASCLTSFRITDAIVSATVSPWYRGGRQHFV